MVNYWKLLPIALLLSACGTPSTAPKVAAVEEVTSNADGTRTVARKVNGLLEGRSIVYQRTGEIAGIFYFHQDKAVGTQYRFYPNGHLADWRQMAQGHAQGDSYGFLENGALATVERFEDGLRTGRNLLFYPHPVNKLHKLIEFVPVEGKEFQNGYLEYDTLGRVVAHSGFPQVRAERDTVALGDSLALQMSIKYPSYEHIAASIGIFDAQFRLRDSASFRLVPGRGRAVTMRLPATQRGQQVARGYLTDFRGQMPGEKPEPGSKSHKSAGQRFYFAYPYFVR